MSKKDFNKGMEAGAKPFEEKFVKLSDETKKIGENIDKNLNNLGEVMDVMLDNLSDMQKKELYDLNTPYDLKKDLDDDEKEILAALLLFLSDKVKSNEYQQKFIRSVNSYIGIVSPQKGIDVSCIENIENINSQKIIMQTAMEYLFLEFEDFSFMDDWSENLFDYFSVNKKGVKDIEGYILSIYNAVGKIGLSEKYGFVPEKKHEEIIKEEFPVYEGNDICEAAADAVNCQHYVVLDDYLVYGMGHGRDDKIKCVEKKTGKIKEIDLQKICGVEVTDDASICGNGKYIFIVNYWGNDNGDIFQLDIESLKANKIDTIKRKINFPRDLYLCCDEQYIVYYADSNIVYIDYMNNFVKNKKNIADINGLIIYQNKIYYNSSSDGRELHVYDINSCKDILITKDMDYDINDFLNDSFEISIYKNYIFQVFNKSYGTYYNPAVYAILDIKSLKKVDMVQVPKSYSIGCFARYNWIYCIEENEEMNRYNVITGESEYITRVPQCISSYTEGIFKKTTIKSVDKGDNPNVIGHWIYYKGSTSYELMVREYGSVYKIDLNSQDKKPVKFIMGKKY